MSKRYTFVWDMGIGDPVEAHLSMNSIAWLIGTRHIRRARIFTFVQNMMPLELIPLINRDTHEVAIMDPTTGLHVDRASYPYIR